MPVVRYTVIDGSLVAEKRNGVRSLYVPDTQGNTVALLDNTQTQTDQWKHMPYGEATHTKGSNPTPFTFIGEKQYRTDSPSRTYVRARVVEPPKARWLTIDPIGMAGGLNVYLYVGCQPTTVIDPSGLYPTVGPGCTGQLKKAIQRMIDQICKKLPGLTDPKHILPFPGSLACMTGWCKQKDAKVDCLTYKTCATCSESYGGPDSYPYGHYPGPGSNPIGNGTNEIYICSVYLSDANCVKLGLCDSILHELAGNCGSSHRANPATPPQGTSVGAHPTDPCEKISRQLCSSLLGIKPESGGKTVSGL